MAARAPAKAKAPPALVLVLVLVLAAVFPAVAAAAEKDTAKCPCADAGLCAPVGGDAPLRSKEIFGFMPSEPLYADWTRITTIAWAEHAPELLCKAHEHDVKVVAGPGGIYAGPVLTANATRRREWAEGLLAAMEARFMDGVTFDFENPLSAGSPEVDWYTALVATTRDVFHAANPGYQVTVCVAWSPDDIDQRGYDYRGLADASDALYVMDYDTRSWIFGPCIAAANAPYFGAKYGLGRYLDLGIPPSKLILGVPWYGYRYPCLPGTAPDARFCPIREVPWRGINCTDAAGTELDYDQVLDRFRRFNTTPMNFDHNQNAPFFNTVEDGVVHQYHFDNPRSLRLKYELARSLNLRGFGPYTFTMTTDVRMWEAFDAFRAHESNAAYNKRRSPIVPKERNQGQTFEAT